MVRLFFAAMTAVIGATHGGLAQAQPASLTKPIEYYNPDWSPDGRVLLFESTLDGKYSVYTIRADGSGLQRLTVNDANNEQPRWSADGKRIVFSSDRAGHLDLYLMKADGSGQTRLTTTFGGGHYQSSFSPDGQWIVFQGRPDNALTCDRIYLIRSDGTGWRQLTDSSYGAEGPRWSPDGKTITFHQVPYPKRFWNEMGPEDMAAARKGERVVAIRPDGSGLSPVAGIGQGDSPLTWSRDGQTAFFSSERDGVRAIYMMDARGTNVRRVTDAAGSPSPVPSPDGQQLAYTKEVEGWSGLYVYDITARRERLVTGGPGAGPLGYLRAATLSAGTDTLDTYESAAGGGSIERGKGAYVVSAARRTSGRRWELIDTWFDSAGNVTARQYSRTAPGSLATELETVRAPGDSASMLITADRVTAWVVPAGRSATLFDASTSGERYGDATVMAAIAAARPAAGQVFVAPVYSLYGGNPVTTRLDSLRVVRRDTLRRGTTPVEVLVIQRGGGETWVDEHTGRTVLERGSAGPNRWWWHIRRGVQPPGIPR